MATTYVLQASCLSSLCPSFVWEIEILPQFSLVAIVVTRFSRRRY